VPEKGRVSFLIFLSPLLSRVWNVLYYIGPSALFPHSALLTGNSDSSERLFPKCQPNRATHEFPLDGPNISDQHEVFL
jgi:hypothetical protein